MIASNYVSRLNKVAKSHTEAYIVTAIYADARCNVVYRYRTLRGAESQVEYLRRIIASDAARSLGSEIPMVDVEMRRV